MEISNEKNIEKNLKKEIEETLKRDKIVGNINNALSQGAEIVFLFLTFSSLSVGFLKFTYNQENPFLVNRALNNAMSLAIENRNKQGINEIPVVIFTTGIDAINVKHKIFSLMVPFPVKNNNNKFEANRDSLNLHQI